ncbi:hypothetical protein [Formosa sp. L2A11]|uniref:hypothetical protein n=1 Tax=Formosa sp. L2A11 TaxID=2686363 RepID=UPI00131D7D06|nr:hypothetical protein [Formosa sp. L2A11]
MRTFNEREKEVLKMLYNISNDKLELFSFHLQHKYFKDLTNSALFLFPKREEVILYIPKVHFDDLEKRKSIMMEFMEFLSLISFLKEERFINIIPNEDVGKSELHIMRKDFNNPKIEQSTQNIILNENGDYIDTKQAHLILDSDSEIIFEGVGLQKLIYNQVTENCMGLLFVSEELKEFVRNKYMSKEDLRYKRSQIATWIGISLAIIFGILGLFNPFNHKQNTVPIEPQELSPIIKNSNEIHQDIHKIIEIIEKQ